jgi:hypothetical protein
LAQVITVLAAFVVFPIRARTRLRKCTARVLERTGGLALQLLGEFCEVRGLLQGFSCMWTPASTRPP